MSDSALTLLQFSLKFFQENKGEILAAERLYFGNDAWVVDNFLTKRDKKFALSFFLVDNEFLTAYCVASAKENTFYIHRFVVLPSFLGKGIGQKMFGLANEIAFANKFGRIGLKVDKTNQRALKFYKDRMMQIEGRFGKYLLMEKEVQGIL